MALPQPNFVQLAQHLTNAATQISLIPNISPPAAAPTLAQIQQLIENIPPGPTLAQIQVLITNAQTALQNSVDQLSQRLSLQIYNSRLPNDAALRYPPTVPIVTGMPLTKQDLMGLNVVDCQTTATALGVPPLGPSPLMAQRRAQIQDFLGAI